MLGKWQRETLARYARSATESREEVQLQVLVFPWRRFTREAGGGSGHPILLRLVYLVDHEHDQVWLATCQTHTAQAKAVEIARHLRDDLHVDPSLIVARWERRSNG